MKDCAVEGCAGSPPYVDWTLCEKHASERCSCEHTRRSHEISSSKGCVWCVCATFMCTTQPRHP